MVTEKCIVISSQVFSTAHMLLLKDANCAIYNIIFLFFCSSFSLL